ncbi:hypothetical protein HMPREF9550_01523 [Escherichia coli MS 187-1]|nr:hypothetical protein HMPREF9550_01523 [Escherichia coli MS 187-1]
MSPLIILILRLQRERLLPQCKRVLPLLQVTISDGGDAANLLI